MKGSDSSWYLAIPNRTSLSLVSQRFCSAGFYTVFCFWAFLRRNFGRSRERRVVTSRWGVNKHFPTSSLGVRAARSTSLLLTSLPNFLITLLFFKLPFSCDCHRIQNRCIAIVSFDVVFLQTAETLPYATCHARHRSPTDQTVSQT